MTTQTTSTLNLDPFQKSLHTTHISLTLNMDLTPNYYILRKLNTNKTQILHRNRLRKYNPEKPPHNKYQGNSMADRR